MPADADYKIRSDVAIAEGWEMPVDPPSPVKCQFCGKMLYHYGIKQFTGRRGVYAWIDEPERCDCENARQYWLDYDRKKKEVEEAEKRKAADDRAKKRISRLLKNSGIRGRFALRTFDRYQVNNINRKAYETCKRFADEFSSMLPSKDDCGNVFPPRCERNGLFITGGYGVGKTHLACAIANQLIQSGTPVICMTMIDLLAKIKSTFESGDSETEADVMRLYEEIPLLIIDDFGSEQPTEWSNTHIYSLINARYEAYMPIIITTNYSADELIRRMTPSYNGKLGDKRNAEKTLDRLREVCVGMELNWDSWRVKH